MNLAAAFRMQSPGASQESAENLEKNLSARTKGLCLAFVGAGGKTSAIFQLARQLSTSVIVTTTTHLGVWQLALADHQFQVHDLGGHSRLELPEILPPGVSVITGPIVEEDRVCGPVGSSDSDQRILQALHLYARQNQLPLLIEADGARGRALKAPADHEPAIPDFVDGVVVVAGLRGLNQPLDSNLVHRPERFAELADIKIGSQVDDESLLRVLLSSEGGLKNIPSGARRIVLLNQADTPALQSQALRMADQLLEGYSSVVIASLNSKPGEALVVREKIAGIILAAGGATRFATAGGLNMPKPLLIWRGEPFVCHVARHALQAGLQPVVVVTGFAAAQIEQVLTGMDLQIVRHMDWMQGQSSSIQAGLQALPRDTGAALFLLADQPQIPPTLIHSFVETHSRTFAPIIAPLIDGMRGNPVLFDRSTFSAFATLRGDVGGRVLFSRFPVEWIPWHDPHCLLDVDTPEDYHALLAFDDQ